MCLRLVRPKVQIKVPNYINTEWVIPEKFLGLIYFILFLLYPCKFQTKQDFTLRLST